MSGIVSVLCGMRVVCTYVRMCTYYIVCASLYVYVVCESVCVYCAVCVCACCIEYVG